MKTTRAEAVLVVVLVLATVNTAYLSWRFIALRSGLVEPGTGICSLTTFVDCDRVLLRPEARAFYVPNALLGFGFFAGCLVWWLLGKRLGDNYRHHVARTLAFWLGVSCIATLWFFWLLTHLPNFCPLCPWNHLLNYIAFISALLIALKQPRPAQPLRASKLGLLVATCVGFFLVIQFAWAIVFVKGYVR